MFIFFSFVNVIPLIMSIFTIIGGSSQGNTQTLIVGIVVAFFSIMNILVFYRLDKMEYQLNKVMKYLDKKDGKWREEEQEEKKEQKNFL